MPEQRPCGVSCAEELVSTEAVVHKSLSDARVSRIEVLRMPQRGDGWVSHAYTMYMYKFRRLLL